jgi:ATP-dependent protease Clp ATPase subunit
LGRFGAPISAVDDEEADESTGISESRVQELIAKHVATIRPVETIIKVMQGDKVSKIEGAKHPKLAMFAKAMSARMLNGFHVNVWLFGPTASGKTHSTEQVSKAMGLKFYMHGAMSMSHELMGYKRERQVPHDAVSRGIRKGRRLPAGRM